MTENPGFSGYYNPYSDNNPYGNAFGSVSSQQTNAYGNAMLTTGYSASAGTSAYDTYGVYEDSHTSVYTLPTGSSAAPPASDHSSPADESAEAAYYATDPGQSSAVKPFAFNSTLESSDDDIRREESLSDSTATYMWRYNRDEKVYGEKESGKTKKNSRKARKAARRAKKAQSASPPEISSPLPYTATPQARLSSNADASGLLYAILTHTARRRVMLARGTPASPLATVIFFILYVLFAAVPTTVAVVLLVVSYYLNYHIPLPLLIPVAAVADLIISLTLGLLLGFFVISASTYGLPKAYAAAAVSLSVTAGLSITAGVLLFLLGGLAFSHWDGTILVVVPPIVLFVLTAPVLTVSAAYYMFLTYVQMKGNYELATRIQQSAKTVMALVKASMVVMLVLFITSCTIGATTAGICVALGGYCWVIPITVAAGDVVVLAIVGMVVLFIVARAKKL
ncbi:hypothetical protein J8273_7080 [Carpediemonas membranifera]|uniref:Uncharacterized protein n=1 Tax=Carpediemonas membranifera TaxID=201153 RepID=A0A8J6DZS2_9EUKA|nr:hypothetical protein J8273_7080 [Carpediemonas membranifera]|eukprot:KAG9390821.1 hypothetical protein J8273_7080 [Carpediemonas membranifera]